MTGHSWPPGPGQPAYGPPPVPGQPAYGPPPAPGPPAYGPPPVPGQPAYGLPPGYGQWPGHHLPPGHGQLPPRLRPKASGTVWLTVAGAVLVVACLLVLPWAEAGGDYAFLPEFADRLTGDDFGQGYAGSPFPWAMAVLGIIYAFGATLDSPAWRWTHFVLVGGVGLFLALAAGVYLARRAGSTGGPAAALLSGIAVIAAALVLALLRGTAVRVVGGLLLVAYAVVHAVAVYDLFDGGADPLPFAYTATLGYLLCATGAFLGPRYVPALR